MAYVYPESDIEATAVALLKANGWTVKPPACPECNGLGTLTRLDLICARRHCSEPGHAATPGHPIPGPERWIPGMFGAATRPCSLGCERPSFYY